MRHKILIVDDEENILLVVKEAFAGKYEVFTASEGAAAIEIVKRERPAFMFLDIKMPGMSGIEVLDLVKGTGVEPIVWMLTGEEDLKVAAATLENGAQGYITKPFDIDVIRKVVVNALEDLGKTKSQKASGEKPWHVKGKE